MHTDSLRSDAHRYMREGFILLAFDLFELADRHDRLRASAVHS